MLLALTAFLEHLAEHAHGLDGVTVVQHLALVEQDDAVAHLLHLAEGVRDDDDRLAGLLEGADAVEALALERLVADGQDLVDEQDVGVGVHGDGEREPHVHAR